MTFEETCKDFQARKPKGEPTGLIPWFGVRLEDSAGSVNDTLRRFLTEQGYTYINDFSGNVWFTGNGLDVWTRAETEVKDNMIHFYFCKFEDYA